MLCAASQALAERDGEVTALKARVRGTESELQRLTVSLGAQQRQVPTLQLQTITAVSVTTITITAILAVVINFVLSTVLMKHHLDSSRFT